LNEVSQSDAFQAGFLLFIRIIILEYYPKTFYTFDLVCYNKTDKLLFEFLV